MSKIFIDTNLLAYTLDKQNPEKQIKAREVLQEIVETHQPVTSSQVIKEFYVVATSKLHADPVLVKSIVHNFQNMEIVQIDLPLIEQGIDISIISQLSFWDALIVAAAEKAHCHFIHSGDLNPGQVYRGVVLVNPLEE